MSARLLNYNKLNNVLLYLFFIHKIMLRISLFRISLRHRQLMTGLKKLDKIDVQILYEHIFYYAGAVVMRKRIINAFYA